MVRVSFNTVAVYIETFKPGDFEAKFLLGKAIGGEARCSPGGWFIAYPPILCEPSIENGRAIGNKANFYLEALNTIACLCGNLRTLQACGLRH